MRSTEVLLIQGKLSDLRQRETLLTIQIERDRNSIRLCISDAHDFDDLETHVPALRQTVSEYAQRWAELARVRARIKQLNGRTNPENPY